MHSGRELDENRLPLEALNDEPAIDAEQAPEEDWRDNPPVVQMADALGEIFAWLARGKLEHPDWLTSVGRKAVAMVWALRPDLLGNHSIRALCAKRGLKTRAVTLQHQVARFTEVFGIYHNGSRSMKARKADSEAMKKSWKERKKKGGGK